MEFTQNELDKLKKHPEVIEILIDFNAFQSASAEAIGADYVEKYCDNRITELEMILSLLLK